MRLCVLRWAHPQTQKRLNGEFCVVCILPSFENLRNQKRQDVSGQAVWNHGSLEKPVSREEIKGIDLLSPSHFLFLSGQSFPKLKKL